MATSFRRSDTPSVEFSLLIRDMLGSPTGKACNSTEIISKARLGHLSFLVDMHLRTLWHWHLVVDSRAG